MNTYAGTPTTVVLDQTLTPELWNAEVRDPLLALAGSWNAFTPTLSQGASTDISATKACEYIRVGKLVIARYNVDATAAGTAGGVITLTLPVTASRAGVVAGAAHYVDASADDVLGSAFLYSTTTVVIYTQTGYLGSSPAVTVASGDVFMTTITYEAA